MYQIDFDVKDNRILYGRIVFTNFYNHQNDIEIGSVSY